MNRLPLLVLVVSTIALAACGGPSDVSVSNPDSASEAEATPAVTIDLGADAWSCDDARSWVAGADPTANYDDFVQLESGQFVHAEQNVGVLDEPDLGPVVAEVCLELSEVTFTEPFDILPGDASHLAAGTEIREIVGADPDLRVGVVVDGKVRIYEAWDRPTALGGGQLLDLGSNIDEIRVGTGGSDATLVSVTEPEAVEGLLDAARSAAVDHTRPPGPPAIEPDYLVEFRRSDGTSTRRAYRPVSGWLEPSILLPEETRLLLVDLIAAVDPSIAAPPVDTTDTSSTTAPPAVEETTTTEDDDPGFIPVPTNQTEAALRFDFGAIVGTSIDGDLTWIQFDRYQVADGTNGTELTAEVRFEGATDLPWANENSRFRWYPLAPDVEVLELEADWFNILCDGEPGEVAFVPSSLNRLLALDARLVSLTVIDREVVRIRDQRSC